MTYDKTIVLNAVEQTIEICVDRDADDMFCATVNETALGAEDESRLMVLIQETFE